MKPVDKILIGIGCGFVVAGWYTRHPELELAGGMITAAYVIVGAIRRQRL